MSLKLAAFDLRLFSSTPTRSKRCSPPRTRTGDVPCHSTGFHLPPSLRQSNSIGVLSGLPFVSSCATSGSRQMMQRKMCQTLL